MRTHLTEISSQNPPTSSGFNKGLIASGQAIIPRQMDELISKSHLWKGWILSGKIDMVKLILDGISLVTNNMAHFKNMLTVWDDALKLF